MSRNDKNQQEDPNYHGEINVSWVLPAFGALVAVVTVPIFLAGLWKKWNEFTSEPTTEEVVEQRSDPETQRKENEKQAAKAEKQRIAKQELINSLGKSQTAVRSIDFKEFTKRAQRETELQNDMTRNELKDNYIKLTGHVYEIDTAMTKEIHGLYRYNISLWEPKFSPIKEVMVAAKCYAESDERYLIINASYGDRLTIVGKVDDYGDWVGLQIRKCSVVGHQPINN